jgi:hypothetical protein
MERWHGRAKSRVVQVVSPSAGKLLRRSKFFWVLRACCVWFLMLMRRSVSEMTRYFLRQG